MFRRAGLVFAVLLAWGAGEALPQGPPPFLPSFEGTPREQAACRPDVVKMCREFLAPQADTFRILSCLQSNRGRLSPACYEVLRSHNQIQ